ncbi:hypothetical protein BDQ12DRAFT_734328 [Crucibulum laeve]|uniref:Uncharacterized protein n=1 Tax=Crucibulum laeve TaxID=68775 RepID=A0A5C3M6Q8_9AGAR|nr:hypothetical protein BDQ12DRAFT_734328 [Crucibulum laeve]
MHEMVGATIPQRSPPSRRNWISSLLSKCSPSKSRTPAADFAIIESEYLSEKIDRHGDVELVMCSLSEPHKLLDFRSTPIRAKIKPTPPLAPSKRPRLRELTLVSELQSMQFDSQPCRSGGSSYSQWSRENNEKCSSSTPEPSTTPTSYSPSTPMTPSFVPAALPIHRRSVGYLREGKPIHSPHQASSEPDEKDKDDGKDEEKKDRDMGTVSERPTKKFIKTRRRDLVASPYASQSSLCLGPPPTPPPTCPLPPIPTSDERAIYPVPISAPLSDGLQLSSVSPTKADLKKPNARSTPRRPRYPSSTLTSTSSISCSRSSPPTIPPSIFNATSSSTTPSPLREEFSASQLEPFSSSSSSECPEASDRFETPPPPYTTEEAAAIPRLTHCPRRHRPKAIFFDYAPSKPDTQDAFSLIPVRTKRATMAARRGDNWTPSTPFRRSTRFALGEDESGSEGCDENDEEAEEYAQQDNRDEDQQGDEIEFTAQDSIRWTLSTASLPEVKITPSKRFSPSIPSHRTSSPLRSCLRVRSSPPSPIVSPRISVIFPESSGSCYSTPSAYEPRSRWSDDTLEEYLRWCNMNKLERALEWVASLSKDMVGWLRGFSVDLHVAVAVWRREVACAFTKCWTCVVSIGYTA